MHVPIVLFSSSSVLILSMIFSPTWENDFFQSLQKLIPAFDKKPKNWNKGLQIQLEVALNLSCLQISLNTNEEG